MLRYIAIFSLTYAAIIVACAVVAQVLDIGAFGSIAALIGGASVTSFKFTKSHGRVPTSREKQSLLWGSLGASFLVSGILASLLMLLLTTSDEVALLLQTFRALAPMIWLFGFLAVAAVSLLVLYLSYTAYARFWLKKHPAWSETAPRISESPLP